ncbi:carcinoembryonic antigen-related cell adhesion molecule 19 [Lontra canadensis]|uniref:carcinoembryonic antigen-related cell adhesion molecule 19 n=1 Tax=Lontra canadensis TaxID=76717 RepID=UPI0013F2C4C9|nr:carcinoembryonic antigen-related cell adhesion molecule 19 [Lontra canadensis]
MVGVGSQGGFVPNLAEELKDLPRTHLPVSAGIMAALIIGSLAAGSLFVRCIAHLLLTRGWKGQSHRMTPTEKPEAHPSHNAGDQNIYEVMPSPTFLVSPPSDTGSTNTSMVSPTPCGACHLQPDPENRPYQDLLNPDPAPYCQLMPTP